MRIPWRLWNPTGGPEPTMDTGVHRDSAGSAAAAVAGGKATAVPRAGSVLAVCLLVLVGCGGEPAATRLELADLARFTEQYDGERVSTTGHVRSHPDPEHYWIEDEDLNRVAVQPDSALKALVGERVRVVGLFRYSREKGRAIEADVVEVLEDRGSGE